jgi:hypothetical protein
VQLSVVDAPFFQTWYWWAVVVSVKPLLVTYIAAICPAVGMMLETFNSVVALILPTAPKPMKEAGLDPLMPVPLLTPAASIPCCPLAD